MRALVADPSASPALALADVPEPTPGPGQLLIDMEAASVNRGEVRLAPKLPAGTVAGWDVAGTVAALGEGVTQFDVGERVVALNEAGGSFAERVVVPAAWTAPLPGACDFVTASTLPVAGITAVGINRLARVHAGDRVLVDGEFDVVLDGIGGPMIAALVEATARHGRMVVYGNSADAESAFRIERLYNKGVTMYGFRVFTTVPPEQAVRDMANLAEQVVAGRLAVRVQATAPLADALPLIQDLYARKVTGKVGITRAGRGRGPARVGDRYDASGPDRGGRRWRGERTDK